MTASTLPRKESECRPPRELLSALIDIQVRYPAAYMALQSGDASVLQEYSQRHDFAGMDAERAIVEGAHGPEMPGQVAHLEQRRGGRLGLGRWGVRERL